MGEATTTESGQVTHDTRMLLSGILGLMADASSRARGPRGGRVGRGFLGLALIGSLALAASRAPRPAIPDVATVVFVDRPVPAVLPHRVSVPAPPIQSPPCPAGVIAPEYSHANGAGGHSIQSLRFTNTSDRLCSLAGRPRVTATLDGQPVAEARTGRAFPYDPYPARDLAYGDFAVLAVSTSHHCIEAMRREAPRRRADGVIFHLEGGDLAMPLGLDVTCGFGVTTLGSPRGPGTIPPDIERLTVQLRLPPNARAGERMRLDVSLTNPSPTPVSLEPCPGYRVDINGPGESSAKELALNCDTIKTIGAGQTVSYEIWATMPNEASGTTTVAWSLVPLGEQDVGQLWVYRPLARRCLGPVFPPPPLRHIPPSEVEANGLLANGLFPHEAQDLAGLPTDDAMAARIRRNLLETGRRRLQEARPGPVLSLDPPLTHRVRDAARGFATMGW